MYPLLFVMCDSFRQKKPQNRQRKTIWCLHGGVESVLSRRGGTGYDAVHLISNWDGTFCSAYGSRTRATGVRGRRPRPLDECAIETNSDFYRLSSAPVWSVRTPGGSRTPNPQIRSLMLYPVELRALDMAGEQGFEPRYYGPEPHVLPLDDSPLVSSN